MGQGSSTNASIQIGAGDSQPATIVAARTGYAIRVLGYVLAAYGGGQAWPDGSVATVQWGDGSATPFSPLSGPMGLRESLPLVAPVAPQTEQDKGGYFETASGAALVLQASGNVGGHCTWCYVAR